MDDGSETVASAGNQVVPFSVTYGIGRGRARWFGCGGRGWFRSLLPSRLLKNKTSNLGAQKDAWILCAAQTYTKTSCSVMAH
ncbi:MAG: hypothetical protein JWN34_2065 [Bryobacterales bacterium]|nr:hypothetical protein [Bryobacterales bacterium]